MPKMPMKKKDMHKMGDGSMMKNSEMPMMGAPKAGPKSKGKKRK